MKRTLNAGGYVIEYELTRKSIKNINVRVRPDGVRVSAPKKEPLSSIERLLLENAERIEEALRKAEKTVPGDGKVWLYGEKRDVFAVSGKPASASLLPDGSVLLRLPDPTDSASADACLWKFLRRECELAVRSRVDRLMPYFASRGVGYPSISFNHAKTRWGSCAAKDGKLNFSCAVVMLPPDCINLTVAHELTHFLVQNHSPAFYEELARVVPDHERLRKIMKDYSPYSFFGSS